MHQGVQKERTRSHASIVPGPTRPALPGERAFDPDDGAERGNLGEPAPFGRRQVSHRAPVEDTAGAEQISPRADRSRASGFWRHRRSMPTRICAFFSALIAAGRSASLNWLRASMRRKSRRRRPADTSCEHIYPLTALPLMLIPLPMWR
jgi:hypothetical protein